MDCRVTYLVLTALLCFLSVASCAKPDSGLYAIWGLPAVFGTIDVLGGKYNPMVNLTNYVPYDTTERSMTVDKDGIFWVNLYSVATNTEDLVSIDNGKVEGVALKNVSCPLWEVFISDSNSQYLCSHGNAKFRSWTWNSIQHAANWMLGEPKL